MWQHVATLPVLQQRVVWYSEKMFSSKSHVTVRKTKFCEFEVHFRMSRVRTWVQCQKSYKIGNMKDVIPVGEPSEDRLEDNFKKFLELSAGGKRPSNVTKPKPLDCWVDGSLGRKQSVTVPYFSKAFCTVIWSVEKERPPM